TLVATRRPPRNTTHVTTWGLAEEIPARPVGTPHFRPGGALPRNGRFPTASSACTEARRTHTRTRRLPRGTAKKTPYAEPAASSRSRRTLRGANRGSRKR